MTRSRRLEKLQEAFAKKSKRGGTLLANRTLTGSDDGGYRPNDPSDVAERLKRKQRKASK